VLTARRAATTESADALSQALDWLDRRQESGQTPLGVLTGIAGLDEALDGLFPGRLVTIAARPGNGKSDFAVWIAHHAARAGVPVLFESLEMPGYEVWERRLSLAMKLDLKREAREGRWSQHRAKVLAGRDRLEAMPLVLKESDNAVADMALEVYRMASENRRPKVVIVDHLGWVRHDAPKTRAHHHAVGDTCKALKTLAKQEDLCVVLLVQLNRESVKGGTATRPSLAHLADSGEIERDSDQVVFLWEPDPPETPSAEAAMEFVVAKNRGGRLARIEVDWSKATHRYAERPWMPRMVAA
jgi:replicative DNA helicase